MSIFILVLTRQMYIILIIVPSGHISTFITFVYVSTGIYFFHSFVNHTYVCLFWLLCKPNRRISFWGPCKNATDVCLFNSCANHTAICCANRTSGHMSTFISFVYPRGISTFLTLVQTEQIVFLTLVKPDRYVSFWL